MRNNDMDFLLNLWAPKTNGSAIKLLRLWVGEYSPSRNAFEALLLGVALGRNLSGLVKREEDPSNDWILVTIGEEEGVRNNLRMFQDLQEDPLPVIPCKQDGVNLVPLIPCPYCGGKHGHGAGRGPYLPPPWWAGHRWTDCGPIIERGRVVRPNPFGAERGYYLYVVQVNHSKKNRAFIIG